MNSEVRIVLAAVCDPRQTDPNNPTGHWGDAAFVRKPQIDIFSPTLHHSITPGHSSLIKPNQAILCIGAMRSQSPWGLGFGVWVLNSCLDDSLPSGQNSPLRQSSFVRPGHSQSKCFPFPITDPCRPLSSPYIVSSPVRSTTKGGCCAADASAGSQSANRNSQTAIPVGST